MNATQLYLSRVTRNCKCSRELYAYTHFGYSTRLIEEGRIEFSFNVSNGLQI